MSYSWSRRSSGHSRRLMSTRHHSMYASRAASNRRRAASAKVFAASISAKAPVLRRCLAAESMSAASSVCLFSHRICASVQLGRRCKCWPSLIPFPCDGRHTTRLLAGVKLRSSWKDRREYGTVAQNGLVEHNRAQPSITDHNRA